MSLPSSLFPCIRYIESSSRILKDLLLGPPNQPTHQSASSTSSPPPPSLSPCRRCMESSSLPMDLSSVSRTSARNLRALVRFLISTTFCRISSPSLPRSAATRSSSSAWASTRGWEEDGKRGVSPGAGAVSCRKMRQTSRRATTARNCQEAKCCSMPSSSMPPVTDRPTDCRAVEVFPCTETKGPLCSPLHNHRGVVFCGHPFTGKMFQWLPLHR